PAAGRDLEHSQASWRSGARRLGVRILLRAVADRPGHAAGSEVLHAAGSAGGAVCSAALYDRCRAVVGTRRPHAATDRCGASRSHPIAVRHIRQVLRDRISDGICRTLRHDESGSGRRVRDLARRRLSSAARLPQRRRRLAARLPMGVLSPRAATRRPLGAIATFQRARQSRRDPRRQPARVRCKRSASRRDQIDGWLFARARAERRERRAGRSDPAKELTRVSSTQHRQDLAALVLLAALSFGLYTYRAADRPPVAREQPLGAAVDLLTARGGHDDAGRWLPLFVRVSSDLWIPPVPAYVTLTLGKVQRDGQPGRRAAALVGALGVVLAFVFASEVFRQRELGWVAALLLLCNPA